MQTENPFLDGLAKLVTDAAGAAQGVRAEIDTFVKQRLEKLVADMDFVPREEFEAVRAMAAKARSENERLAARVAALEKRGWRPLKRRIPPKSRSDRKL
jgi:BMFP domain-containing protein YqiC